MSNPVVSDPVENVRRLVAKYEADKAAGSEMGYAISIEMVTAGLAALRFLAGPASEEKLAEAISSTSGRVGIARAVIRILCAAAVGDVK